MWGTGLIDGRVGLAREPGENRPTLATQPLHSLQLQRKVARALIELQPEPVPPLKRIPMRPVVSSSLFLRFLLPLVAGAGAGAGWSDGRGPARI